MQSLLDISDYSVDELHVKANPAYNCDGTPEEPNVLETSIGVKRRGKEPHFMVKMTLELNGDKEDFDRARYHIYLDISGFFGFTDGTDEETIKKMIGLNGPAILYGIARGVVAQATANCRHGKLVLPAVNFVEAMQKQPPGKRRRKTQGKI